MPSYPETSEDTVIYTDRQFIAPEDVTLRLIDEAIASIYGRVFVNGVELVSGGPIVVPDGDKGDISISGGVWTVDDNVVSNAKLADMPANTIKGNNTGSTADPVNLTVAQTKTLLAISNVDNTTDVNKPVSTAQQTALNAKTDKVRTIASKSGAANTAALGDADTYMRFTTSNTVFTIPPNSSVAFPIGSIMEGANIAGAMSLAPGGGVTINRARTLVTAGVFSGWTIIKVATDAWDLHGDFV
jgi:hypothetical protein